MRVDSDTLTQTERLRRVLNHESPDRVPCYLMGMPEYSDFYQEFKAHEDELLATYTEKDENVILTPCGDYTIPVFFGADIIVRGGHVDFPKDQWLNTEGKFVEHGTMKHGHETGLKVTYFGRLEKIDLLPNGYPYMWYEGGFLKTPQQLRDWYDRYGWPGDQKVQDLGPEIESTNKQFDKYIHVIPSYGPGLYENTWFGIGQDRFALFTRKEPELMMKLINSIKDLQIKQIEKARRVHPMATITSDDMGQKGRSLMSPAMHKKFFLQARKEIHDAIHNIGAKAIMHSCGNIVELLPDLVEVGLDGWQTLEPAAEINFPQIKQQFGDRLSFWGGIDNNVLCFGTPEEVKAKVQATAQILGQNGGYIAGPAHDYLNVKVANALSLRDTIASSGSWMKNK